MRPLTLLIMLMLGACVQQTDLLRQRYVATWNERLAGYQEQYRRHDEALRAKIQQEAEALRRIQEVRWTDVTSSVLLSVPGIRESGQIAGRGQTIRQFIAHIETKPTPGLTDVWFQNAVSDLRTRAQKVDTDIRVFNTDRERRSLTDWIKDIERLARESGEVEGTLQELQALYNQAIAYYTEQRTARAADIEQTQRVNMAIAGMAGYLNQLNYQQQMLTAMNRPRTCTRWANSITCY